MPENEPDRLRVVRSYEILDTEPELEFDALTRVAAHTFHAPIAVVAMMDDDRLWFKSKLGLDIPQLDRKVAFCAHAIVRPEAPMVITDLLADARFVGNPLVAQAPHLRFYAGAPIVDASGHALGTIAVIDAQPRPFSQAQRDVLTDLSALVVTALQARRRATDLQRLAMTDHLTGIGNRARFDKALTTELKHSMRTGERFTLLTMDLDGFKDVNDTYGHHAGDEVLHEVARRLGMLVREGDVLARLGGDEFGIVVRHATREAAAALAQRIMASVGQPVRLGSGATVAVGVSVGIAEYSEDVAMPATLLARADQQLYLAKQTAPGRR
jgi:diguanylate cyclase (GGDEF)-like protein